MQRKSWTLLGCVGMVSLALAAACGSDDDSSKGSESTGGTQNTAGQTSTGGSEDGGTAGQGGAGGSGEEEEEEVEDPILVNGSFESGDYSGWTIWEEFEEGHLYYLVEEAGMTRDSGEAAFDHYTQKDRLLGLCPVESGFVEPSHGTKSAVWVPVSSGDHLIRQIVTIPEDRPYFVWEMKYKSSEPIAPAQTLSVFVADYYEEFMDEFPITKEGDPESVLEMTSYVLDLSDYVGLEVILAIQLRTDDGCFVVNFDNFRFVDESRLPE